MHVIAGLDPAHGGPSYSVPRLCEALAAAGAEPALLSVAAGRDPPCDTRDKGYPDRRFAQDLARIPGLRALRRSAAFSAALKEAAGRADLVHDHGLWLLPNLQAGWSAVAAGKPFVVSPRGMLSPAALAFSWARKHAFWKLLQGPVMRRAACIHATSAPGIRRAACVRIAPSDRSHPERHRSAKRGAEAASRCAGTHHLRPGRALTGPHPPQKGA